MRVNSINNFYQNKMLNSNNTNSTLNNISQMKFSCPCDVVSFTSSQVSHSELFEIKKTAQEAKKMIDDFLLNEGSLVIKSASAIYNEASDEKKHVFNCLACLNDSRFKIFAQTPWGTRLQKSIHADEKGSAVLIEEFDAEGKLIKQIMVSGNNPVRTLKITDEQTDVFDFLNDSNAFVVTKNLQTGETEECDAIYTLKSDGESTIFLNSISGSDLNRFEKRIVLRNLKGNVKSIEFDVVLKACNSSSAETRYTFDYNQNLIHYFEGYSSQISTNISWVNCYSYDKGVFYSLIKKGFKPVDVSSAIEGKEAIYKNSHGGYIKKSNFKCKFLDYKAPKFLN